MITKTLFAAAGAAATMVAAGSASAVTLTTYDATAYSGGNSHAMYLFDIETLFAGTSRDFFFNPDGTLLTEKANATDTTGFATLSGNLESETDSADGFTVLMSFNPLPNGTVPSQKGSNSLLSGTDFSTWEYYQVTGGTLTGFGKFAGFNLDIAGRGENDGLFMQLGQNANDKTRTFGMSTWFWYSAADDCTAAECASLSARGLRGDFNVDLSAGSDINPVPVPGAAILLGSAMAGFGALRRRKK